MKLLKCCCGQEHYQGRKRTVYLLIAKKWQCFYKYTDNSTLVVAFKWPYPDMKYKVVAPK